MELRVAGADDVAPRLLRPGPSVGEADRAAWRARRTPSAPWGTSHNFLIAIILQIIWWYQVSKEAATSAVMANHFFFLQTN